MLPSVDNKTDNNASSKDDKTRNNATFPRGQN